MRRYSMIGWGAVMIYMSLHGATETCPFEGRKALLPNLMFCSHEISRLIFSILWFLGGLWVLKIGLFTSKEKLIKNIERRYNK